MRALCALVMVLTLAGTASGQYLKAHVGRVVSNIGGTGWIGIDGASIGFTPSAASDVWVVLLSARLMSDGTGANAEIRFQVNGTTRGQGGIENSAADKGSSWQQFYAVTGTTLRQDITVQFRDAAGPNIVTVEDLTVIAFKLPAGADFHYAEDTVLRSIPGTSWGSHLSLDVTPSSAGDYLVFAVANASEAPSAAGAHVRLRDPSATFWPIDDDPGSADRFFLNDRAPFRSFFLARTETLALGSNPYTIEAKCGAAAGAQLRYQRIMAFRTDVFDSYETSVDFTNTSTSGTAPVVKSSLTTAAPPAARDYITIQNLYLSGGASTTNERRASFDRGGASQSSYAHVISTAAHRVPYGLFDAVTTASPVTYENTFSSSSGAYTVSAKESVIHVLRLPTTDPAAAIGLEAFGNKGSGSNGGPGWGDFNNDGCLDVATGAFDPVFGTTILMQNKAASVCQGTFTNVTDCLGSGLRTEDGERHSLWGDINNDGFLDFIRNSSTKIEIFLNNGPDPTPPAGCPQWNPLGAAGSPSQTLNLLSVQPDFVDFNSEALALVDYDGDRVLELISNMHDEGMVMFENDGTGTFSKALLTGLPTAGSLSGDYGLATDIDVDGDVDILQRMEGLPDLYLNNNDGTFTVAAFDDVADNANKGGVAACDFDTDGDFDLVWTEAGTNQIWEQTGVGTFTARGAPGTFNGVVQGVACGDIDNDGDVDLALTTNADDQLFRNDGGFTFTDVTPSFFGTNDGHGATFADYDRDGDADLLIQQSGNVFLWKNPTNNTNYLTVHVLQDVDGTPGGTTRDALGATVELVSCEGVTMSGIRDVQGGHGHGSQNPAYIHLGLPTSGTPSGASGEYVVHVRFPDGTDIGKAIVPSSIAGYQLLTITSTDATDVSACTTAVELASFDARGVANGIELAWETASELDNFGFHLYRTDAPDGPYRRITEAPIPGLGSSPSGARYLYVDTPLVEGARYYYRLEDIELGGKTELHGPVVARAGGASIEKPPAIRVGTPVSRLTVRERRHDTELVLNTEGFDASPLADGTVELSVDGLESYGGSPELRTWIEAPACRGAEIVSVERRGRERYALRPAGTTAVVEATTRGVVRASRRRARITSSPDAAILDVGYQGDARRALVGLSPLAWDAERSELILTRELVVRISFRSKERCGSPRVRRRSPAIRLEARERGLYAVPLDEVLGRRARPRRLRLSRLGEPVAFHLDRDSRTLYFFSEGARLNPYENVAVYELSFGGGGLRMPVDSGDRSLRTVSTYETFEEDRIYQAGLVDAPDQWLWDVLFAPESKPFPFTLGTASRGEGAVTVALQGTSDSPHRVRISVNELALGETRWSGRSYHEHTFPLPAGTLHAGENTLTLDALDAPSMVMLDKFRVDYTRAVGDAPLIDITGEIPRWAEAPRAERVYFTADLVHRPTPRSIPRRRLDRGRADYVVIGPEAWHAEARKLVRARRRQGLRARFVSVERIFDEFGYGEKRPEAIRDFLAHTLSEWKRAPRYVVLLGDGSYDFLDHFGTGAPNPVPPLIVKTSYLWTASDPGYASVRGDDALPDLALGRLPASTRAQARVMIDKILAWERNGAGLGGRVVLVADNADRAGDFPAEAHALATGLLSNRDVTTLSLGDVGAAAMRDGVTGALDDGASILSYIGHGGIHLWADENIFNTADVGTLSPQPEQPVVLTMNCLNGFFHFPYFDSLAESLLKADGRGAVAVISPSGLSLHQDAKRLHETFLRELTSGTGARLGDAWVRAQASVTSPELLVIYHLFGDPAMPIR